MYTIEELTWGQDTVVDDRLFDIALATDVLYDVDMIEPLFTSVANYVPVNAKFILSHIPRACYNDNNPPEAVDDLEKYIIDKAEEFKLRLDSIIRPPEEDNIQDELLQWCPKTAFSGGAILVFCRT